jgi:superfamily I DNA/RNA helicase
MIPNATLILGPPGCGKTYTLIERVEAKLQEGVHPSRIGVVSFTTKAIGEFLSRSCAKFDLTQSDFPHFRTLHATGYHALGLQSQDVMSGADWSRMGEILGVDFEGKDTTSMQDGIAIPAMGGSGAKYQELIMKSVYRMSTLDYEYNYEADYNLSYEKLVQIEGQLIEYKSKLNKFDFSDMISKYIDIADPPYLDLLIVDEAQDLTPLQWRMVEKMASQADEVLIAGDDDQAIHRWTSVDVREFINCSDKVEVLNKSYRLPRSVWELAMSISARIPGRLEKEFFPREAEGSVHIAGSLWHLPLDKGSWTIMARINGFVNDIARQLESMGHFYSRKGRLPIKEGKITAMRVWKDVTTKGAYVGEVRKMYEAVPKMGTNAVVKRGSIKLLDAAGSEELLTWEALVKDFGLLADINTDPMDIVKLSEEEKLYIRSIERRGESIYREPRIKLSTIHAMKGGEDDNVAVYLGSTKNCVEGKHPEDEHRVFYVAVTRAKERLYLIESDKSYRYKI